MGSLKENINTHKVYHTNNKNIHKIYYTNNTNIKKKKKLMNIFCDNMSDNDCTASMIIK